jgi:glycosyltransferase involved in cell wall biosynthesis
VALALDMETRNGGRRSREARDTARHQEGGVGGSGRRPLRVAVLAPPWIPVPPPGYGGIELVISQLTAGLVRLGHEVLLMAAPGSQSHAPVVELLERAPSEHIGQTLFDIDHVVRALEVLDRASDTGRPFDILHDHSGYAMVAMADHSPVPVLHTVHGPFTPDSAAFYGRYADRVWISGLSEAQLADAPRSTRCVGAIPNPIDIDAWPIEQGRHCYLLWVGRMTADKGPHRAIAAARRAGVPLILAGPVQPGQEDFFAREVAPHIDGHRVHYLREVGGEQKRRLFARAAALLMPIRWPEPFGMVMIEAMACGTPVIAFPHGAAPEIVADGVTGFLVEDEAGMAEAVSHVGELDPAAVRASTAERFGVDVVSGAYERAYHQVIGEQGSQPARILTTHHFT